MLKPAFTPMFKIESQLDDGTWRVLLTRFRVCLTQDVNSWDTHLQAEAVCKNLAAAGFDSNRLRVVEND
jgi:hypothetical protein